MVTPYHPATGPSIPAANGHVPTRADVRDTARAALALGLSVLPPVENGEKRPLTVKVDGKATWTPWQERHATEAEMEFWYGHRTGVAFVCGSISGGIELFEFDCWKTYVRFLETAAALGGADLVEKIEAGYLEHTPGGGVHWFYYTDEVRGSTKLATRPGPPIETLIETKGEGGFAIIAPSFGKVHPSGKPYRLIRGSLATIATITGEERDWLWSLARTFNEPAATEPPPETGEPTGESTGGKQGAFEILPGDDFNARATWEEVLGPHGWAVAHRTGETVYWRRPGKARGHSATTNHEGRGLLHVFTSSSEFESNKSYSLFGAFTRLNHKGDFKAACKALEENGYGKRRPPPDFSAGVGGRPGSNGDGAPPGVPSSNSFNSYPQSAGNEGGDDDDVTLLPQTTWIEPPDPIIYHGLSGEITRAIEPTTEADPLALQAGLMIGFGSIIGRTAYYEVEATRHYANEYAVAVGETSLSRKGTSAERTKSVLSLVDPEWCRWRTVDGLSSGEGLLNAVRDPLYVKEPLKDRGRVTGYQDVLKDEGVTDKRLLVLESEFGGVLRANEREGNRLSAYVRRFWDSGTSGSLTKSPTRATDAHVSIIGHITEQELRERLVGSDVANGFANRFLWFAVRRSKILPFGGDGFDPGPFVPRLRAAVEAARTVGRVTMDYAARVLWESSYVRLTTPAPGRLGLVTSRAAPHVIRAALQYALLDCERYILEEHLAAALAYWDASFRCAAYIFGDSVGNAKADAILTALKSSPGGLTRSEISVGVFQRNAKSEVIKEALQFLIKHGLASEHRETKTGGGPKTVYRAYEKNEMNAKTTTGGYREAGKANASGNEGRTQSTNLLPPSLSLSLSSPTPTPDPPPCGGCLRLDCTVCNP